MKQNFTLILKYNNKSIGFSFDSKGNFLKNFFLSLYPKATQIASFKIDY